MTGMCRKIDVCVQSVQMCITDKGKKKANKGGKRPLRAGGNNGRKHKDCGESSDEDSSSDEGDKENQRPQKKWLRKHSSTPSSTLSSESGSD